MVMRSKRHEFDSDDDYERYLSGLSSLELDEEADRILADDRRSGPKTHSALRDYLSHGQMKTRMSREIYVSTGTPDESLYLGIVKRAYSPPRDGGPRDLREEA